MACSRFAVLMLLVFASATIAAANPITYTATSTVSGAIGAQTFSNVLVRVTTTGNTDDVVTRVFDLGGGSTYTAYFDSNVTTTVTIPGIGTATVTYTGTVEGFATALPGFLKRAASVGGMADRDYSKEIAFIIEAVRTCATITPQMAGGVFEGNGRKTWSGSGGREAVEKLGPQYEVCSTGKYVSQQVTGIPPTARRGVTLLVRPGAFNRLHAARYWGLKIIINQMEIKYDSAGTFSPQ